MNDKETNVGIAVGKTILKACYWHVVAMQHITQKALVCCSVFLLLPLPQDFKIKFTAHD
jgi:hypothetical protein